MADSTLQTPTPPTGKDLLEQQFLEMRWRTLSLAADLDRIERATGGSETLQTHTRAKQLKKAFEILLSTEGPNRAERLQLLISDMTPPPEK
jgi:hypothetical protein